ncbi:MAG: VIT domain-containing protein [Gemmatimonadaceae bacterium]
MRALPLLLTLVAPAVAGAQGLIIPRCPRPLPERPVIECLPTRPQITRTRSDIRVELRDRVLRYEVEERFVNNGGLVGEADFFFPLPKGAAFRDLKLSIDGQLVAGETMSATEARRIYEDIVRRQKDPALVEWMGHGMLRTRIFPIQAGEERRIVVRFESVAEREGDALRVDYFRGSRYAPWAMGSERPAQSAEPRAQSNLTLTYRAGGELGEPYSPTHELDTERDGAVRRVLVRAGGPDITVLVGLRRSMAASVAVLTNATRDEQGYALITVTPPSELAATRLPRDVTLVLDASGSMAGRKMEQAKAAGRQLLRTLTERDRFRVIDFSTDVRSFRDEFVSASEANVRSAIRYLDDIDPTGSTNISGALEEALGGRRPVERDGWDERRLQESERRPTTDRVPLIIFMTDGAATVGERDPAAIAQRAARLRDNARIFSIGMGADVNIGLIEQLALEGRGTAQFVRPEENVEHFVELLASRLRAPLLTNVRVRAEGDVRISQMYPAGPQDIFAGQDLVLLARYDGAGRTNLVVEGNAGGRTVRWSNDRTFARDERDNAFVPRLWATQRIGWLAAEKRRNGGNSEIDDEIRRLGERFGIPTEFTSYLVLEPGMVADRGNRRQDAGAIMRLRGVTPTSAAVGGGAAQSAPAPAMVQFEAAKSASEQRDAKSIAAADAAVMNESAAAGQVRRAGAKLFRRDGERWSDLRMKSDLRVYKVQAYSRTYFALLEKLPELRESFAVSEKVLVAGKGVAIEVVSAAEELSELEIQSIVRNW